MLESCLMLVGVLSQCAACKLLLLVCRWKVRAGLSVPDIAHSVVLSSGCYHAALQAATTVCH
jgi:hypothetical protein